MSVIGRLDKQVEEILISPLGRKEQRAPDAPPEAEAPTTEQAEPQPKPHQTSPPHNEKSEKEELPVWLL